VQQIQGDPRHAAVVGGVGNSGDADLRVENGATLQVGALRVGYGVGSGEMTMTGEGSSFVSSSSVEIAMDASMTVEAGATAASRMLLIHDHALLTGQGTMWHDTASSASVTVYRHGQLEILDGAVLNTLGLNKIGPGHFGDGTARVDLRSAGSAWDMGLNELWIGIDDFGRDGGSGV
jgi:hypothetical protein